MSHAAGSFILTPDGRISRTFYGVSFPGKDLRLALVEASNGSFASAVDKLLLFCFHYEPKNGKYVLAVNWGALRAYEPATGAEAWRVGR